MDDIVKCPKCGSSQISANKKGFSGKKAVAGAILAGPVGLAAGTLGSNEVKITCLKCGNEFYPGERKKEPVKASPAASIIGIISIFILAGCGIFLLIKLVSIFI